MRFNRGLVLLVLLFLAIVGHAESARAWTRTVVQSARATVEIEPEATVYVLLRLDVEVHAGWLHEMELVDLGPDVELDRYRPPYFRSEDGEVFRPEAELHEDGRIRLSFARRDAPRRGEYKVYIRYRSRAEVSPVEVDAKRRARLVWSVPAWETGLHDVSVEFRAPKGTRVPEEMMNTGPGVGVQVSSGPRRTIVRWRRIHLPRLSAWPLALDLPEGWVALPDSEPTAPAPDGFHPLPVEENQPMAWLVLVVAVLVLLKRRGIEKRFGRKKLWIRAPWTTVFVSVIALIAAAQFIAPTAIAWGLPLLLLAMHRRSREPAYPEGRAWAGVALDSADAELELRPLDGTTAMGATLLLAIFVAFFLVYEPSSALLVLPVFFTGTRLHLGPSRAEAGRILASFTASLRIPDEAPPMAFEWQRADDGAHRLRIELEEARTGLVDLCFSATSASLGLLRSRGVHLVVRTRAQSDADDLMRRRHPDIEAVRAMDGTVVRVVAWDAEAIELLRALARRAPKPVKASRGTWLLREITAPGRRAA
jgi:hypothetical protein